MILAIDSERERISLGMKQVESDPFEEFFIDHPISTAVEASIESIEPKRVVIKLPHGLQGSIRRDEFTEEPEVGSSVTAIISSEEPKNFMIQLTTRQLKTPKIKVTGPSSSEPIASPTLGDLMKNQMNKDGE